MPSSRRRESCVPQFSPVHLWRNLDALGRLQERSAQRAPGPAVVRQVDTRPPTARADGRVELAAHPSSDQDPRDERHAPHRPVPAVPPSPMPMTSPPLVRPPPSRAAPKPSRRACIVPRRRFGGVSGAPRSVASIHVASRAPPSAAASVAGRGIRAETRAHFTPFDRQTATPRALCCRNGWAYTAVVTTAVPATGPHAARRPSAAADPRAGRRNR